MKRAKIAITVDRDVLGRLDRLIRERVFPNRSRVIQQAVEAKLQGIERGRLARECAKLDPAFEKSMAEEGLSAELGQWPAY